MGSDKNLTKLKNAPNLFVIGPPKTGTTTLYDILKSHPDIYLPEVKEPGFFSDEINFSKGIAYYLDAYYKKAGNKKYRGDFSPTYYASSVALERIRELIGGNVKIVIVIRDPVERAYSHYLHKVKDGVENRTFENALRDDWQDDNDFGYVSNSLYANKIEKTKELFGLENVLVLNFENDIVGDANRAADKICEFLKINRHEYDPGLAVSNPASDAMPGTKWVRGVFHRQTPAKRLVKRILPAKVRQKIRLSFDKLTTKNNVTKRKIEKNDADKIFSLYFQNDVEKLNKYLHVDYSAKYKAEIE